MVLTGLARTHSPVKSFSQIAQSNLTELLAMTMSADDEDDTQPVMDLDSVTASQIKNAQESSSSSSSSSSPSTTTSTTLSQDAYQMLRAPAPAVLYPDFIALFAMQGQQQQQQQQPQQRPQNLLILITHTRHTHIYHY